MPGRGLEARRSEAPSSANAGRSLRYCLAWRKSGRPFSSGRIATDAYAFAFFHLAQRALAASDIFLRAAGDICRLRPFVGPAFDDDLPFARPPPFSAAMARFRFSNCSSNWAMISAVSMSSPSSPGHLYSALFTRDCTSEQRDARGDPGPPNM